MKKVFSVFAVFFLSICLGGEANADTPSAVVAPSGNVKLPALKAPLASEKETTLGRVSCRFLQQIESNRKAEGLPVDKNIMKGVKRNSLECQPL